MRWLAAAVLAGLAWRRAVRVRGVRIVRIGRAVADLDRAEAFYRDALGFRRLSTGRGDPALGASHQVVMRLGDAEIALVRFDRSGAHYPVDSRSDDLWFQHIAVVVSDMAAAYAILAAHHPGAITQGGPQTLPPRNGGVSAFKFRDPDGHPVELLHFPPGQGRAEWQNRTDGPFLGIDHSALAVVDTARSVRFYRRLGLSVAARSFNHGPAQDRLDGLQPARADITGLRPAAPTGPGLELLAYRSPGRPMPPSLHGMWRDWVTVFDPSLRGSRLCRDPDGHLVLRVGREREAPPAVDGRMQGD